MPQVKLRKKPISKGRHSYYLDFYPAIIDEATGESTRRQFLGLYIYDRPKNELEKLHNKDTTILAENIKAQRQLAIQDNNFGFTKKKIKGVDYINYFVKLAERQTSKDREIWLVVSKYLSSFTNNNLKSTSINVAFCNDFKEYLRTTNSRRSKKVKLSENATHSYFKKFRLSLKQAFADGIIAEDLFPLVKPIPQAETHREFLSKEELQKLVKTECSMPILKQAGIFSALTGLRFSDIEKMLWEEIRYSKENGYYIQFIQKKTGGAEVLPISKKAYSLLGEKRKPKDKVFEGLKYSAYTNLHLKTWIAKAGISKDITFHSFRHTFATLQLTAGTDIYTVSKLLGHKELETTQIYAKIVDEKKQRAVNMIDIDV